MTEKCSSCEQMKQANKELRKALLDTNKNYVEVVNENLNLLKQLGANRSFAFREEDPPPAPMVADPNLIIEYPKGLHP